MVAFTQYFSPELNCVKLIENVKHYLIYVLAVVNCHLHAIGGGAS